MEISSTQVHKWKTKIKVVQLYRALYIAFYFGFYLFSCIFVV